MYLRIYIIAMVDYLSLHKVITVLLSIFPSAAHYVPVTYLFCNDVCVLSDFSL